MNVPPEFLNGWNAALDEIQAYSNDELHYEYDYHLSELLDRRIQQLRDRYKEKPKDEVNKVAFKREPMHFVGDPSCIRWI